jgi:hypothetical protein
VKTIVILTRRPDADTAALARLSRDELLALWKGMASGAVRAAHGLHEAAGAVLEMETSTTEDAKRFVEALPYVQQALLDVQYCPLKPFPAFEALSSTTHA